MRISTEEPIRISVYDLLKYVCTHMNPRSAWATLLLKNREIIKYTMFQYKGHGQRPTPVVTVDDLKMFIKIILDNCPNVPTPDRKCWVEFVGMTHIHNVMTRAESDHMNSIKLALGAIQCIPQYYANPYRIDLYIPDYKIAIECDEHMHKHYKVEKEEARTQHITDQLGCTWIRFDPYCVNFRIESVIALIYEKIMGTNKTTI